MTDIIPVPTISSSKESLEVTLETATDGSTDSSEEKPRGRRRSRLKTWLKVIFVALFAALILRVFAFEAYRIPSASMEDTLLVGDFLFVSKLHYGARTPITLGIPFTGWYLKDFELPAVRLPGFTSVQRNDVVVFNYPPDDAPIDRRMHYIKRVMALPGDTLSILEKRVVVNGEELPLPGGARQFWRATAEDETAMPTRDTLSALGFKGRMDRLGPGEWLFEGTTAQAEAFSAFDGVDTVESYLRLRGDRSATFPSGGGYSLDDYGPIVVPRRGATVTLDDATWRLYREVITRYEGTTAQRVAGGFEIAGAMTNQYTFQQDYFFVMGDNRDDSADSRSWGFVPASHLVGKAVLIYFSWDSVEKRPRWGRVFRGIG
ncbi:MAG: signal peptidase I [Bacteroidetes bacterium]|nr:signal peptidase I [Bacteroidota bacterium]